ncbi:MAG: DMT family transporter [Desulfonauticus sp.]|nr:DMT family transporter [Desulfonauticus sp.]
MHIIWSYGSLLLSVFLWGSSFIVFKVAVNFYSPLVIIFFRMLIASLIFCLIWPKIRPSKITLDDLKLICLMCLFEPCLYFLLEGYALKYTSASQASIIVSTLPLMVATASFFILKEKVNLKVIIAFLVSILGVIVLTFNSDVNVSSQNPLLGNFLELLAMVMATGYIILARYLGSKFHPFFLAFAQAALGTIFFFPLVLLFDNFFLLKFSFWPFLSVLYLGVMVTFLAYSLYNFSLTRIQAAKAAAFTNFIPAVSIILSFFLLGERLNYNQVLGVVLIVVGIISQNFSFSRFKKH